MGFIYQPQNLKTLVYVKNKNYLKEGKKLSTVSQKYAS